MTLRLYSRDTTRPRLRQIFISRAFGLLWGGQSISLLGSSITASSIPLIAILVLGAGPAQVGLLAALGALPGLLLSLPIGVWVDRLPRRLLLLVTDLLRALLLLTLPLASLRGLLHLPLLAVVTVLLSSCTICFDTAYQAFLPQIIAPEQLIEGNSKLGASSSLAEMGGPPLAGILIQSIGAPLAVLFDVLSFLISALTIGLIHPREIQLIPLAEEPEPFWRAISEGIRILIKHRLVCVLVIYSTIRDFFGGTFLTLYALYIVRELHIPPAFYGVLVALGGVGALTGSLLLPRLAQRVGTKRLLLAGALLHSSLTLLTPLAGGSMFLMIGMLGSLQFVGDIGFQLYALNEISIRQRAIPAQLQGRVNAVRGFLLAGVAPAGALLAGIVSVHLGIRLTLLCGAGGMLLTTLWLLHALS